MSDQELIDRLRPVEGGPDKTFVLELPAWCADLSIEDTERMRAELSQVLNGAKVVVIPPGSTLLSRPERRLKILNINSALLLSIFEAGAGDDDFVNVPLQVGDALPAGCSIDAVSMHVSFVEDALALRLSHPSFPVVGPMEPIGSIAPQYRRARIPRALLELAEALTTEQLGDVLTAAALRLASNPFTSRQEPWIEKLSEAALRVRSLTDPEPPPTEEPPKRGREWL